MLGYSYEILYKPGKQNRAADALSRIHETEAQCLGLTVPHCEFLNKLKIICQSDPAYQKLCQSVQQTPSQFPHFQFIGDMLFFKGKVYIPSNSPVKYTLMEEFHASLLGGHSGVTKTLGRLKDNVYWEGMQADVAEFVKACIICQQTKIPAHLPYGLLQPLPIPENVWEDVSLDFIVGLPSFQNNTTILVVVDRLSKAAHFGMLPTNFTAVRVAELFAKMVSCVHGMPKSMVSDRDPIFLSKFWQELFRLSGTKLRMSSAYHPQSDGQTEVVNKSLQQYLRCFAHQQPRLWGKYLHWAEWHYNTSIHTATGLTPYQVVFGKPPPTLQQYVSGSTANEALQAEFTSRDEILQILKKKLAKAQEAMKLYADKRRLAHPFKIGDLVFVKLRPYRQVSLAGHRCNKLAKCFYGPYQIIRAIGEVSFELQLPATSKIHPVFHASQLKPCFGPASATLELPPEAIDNKPVVEPLAVLDTKMEGDRKKC